MRDPLARLLVAEPAHLRQGIAGQDARIVRLALERFLEELRSRAARSTSSPGGTRGARAGRGRARPGRRGPRAAGSRRRTRERLGDRVRRLVRHDEEIRRRALEASRPELESVRDAERGAPRSARAPSVFRMLPSTTTCTRAPARRRACPASVDFSAIAVPRGVTRSPWVAASASMRSSVSAVGEVLVLGLSAVGEREDRDELVDLSRRRRGRQAARDPASARSWDRSARRPRASARGDLFGARDSGAPARAPCT